jgi:hypothetical protein
LASLTVRVLVWFMVILSQPDYFTI